MRASSVVRRRALQDQVHQALGAGVGADGRRHGAEALTRRCQQHRHARRQPAATTLLSTRPHGQQYVAWRHSRHLGVAPCSHGLHHHTPCTLCKHEAEGLLDRHLDNLALCTNFNLSLQSTSRVIVWNCDCKQARRCARQSGMGNPHTVSGTTLRNAHVGKSGVASICLCCCESTQCALSSEHCCRSGPGRRGNAVS